MKKLFAAILLVVLAFSLAACGEETDPSVKSEGVMTYEEYDKAAIGSEVVIEAYVQATQAWWENKITVYAADPDGAYFIYELACSETEAARLTKGTKIKVSGKKAEWSGEVEIVEATFEFGNDVKYESTPADLSSLLGKDELIKHQNQLAAFKGMTVIASEYQGGVAGKDIYLTLAKNGALYDFCVESYLTDATTEVYKAVEALNAGDVIDVEGFAYWYNGLNTHITAVKKVGSAAAKSEGVMTYEEYINAELESDVVIEVYVQAHQDWWDNKVTVYAADPDGAYFIYELTCSEADAAKLTKGAKIKVTGQKTAWSGEVEIASGATFEFVNDGITYISLAKELTHLLGKDELIDYQNAFAKFRAMTVVSVEYQGGVAGKDIYLKLSKDGKEYDFCVESYLTGAETEVYKAVEALKAGDIIDVEGFVYWYNGLNTHVTSVKAPKN